MAGNDSPAPATFLLTRNAALDLRRIYARSSREWGEEVADRYLADPFAASCEIFALKVGGEPRVVAAFAGQE